MSQRINGFERGLWCASLFGTLSLCLIFGLGYSLSEGVWFDEVLTIYFIGLDWANLFEFINKYEANMALYYGALKVWSVFFESELWLRLFSLFCFAGAVWFLFISLRRSFGIRTGLAFIGLCLGHFYLARYSVEIRGYALAMLFMAVLWFFWTRIVLEKEQNLWLTYALIGAFAVHSHFFIAIGIFCLGLMSLPVLKGRDDLLKWLGAHALIGLGFLPVVAFVIFKESGQLAWLDVPGLKTIIYLLFEYSGAAPQASDILRFGLVIMTGFLVCAGLLNTLASSRNAEWRSNRQLQFFIGALVIAFVPVAIVFLVSQLEPIFSTRFFMPFMPFYMMLCAIGLVFLFRSWSPVLLAVAAGIMALSANAYTDRESNRWARAYNHLADHCMRGDAVLYMTPRTQAAVNFYEQRSPSGCSLTALPYSLSTENYFYSPEMYPKTLTSLEQYNTVWIVVSHLSTAEKNKLEQYRMMVESEVGLCQQSYSNAAIEMLRCDMRQKTEAGNSP